MPYETLRSSVSGPAGLSPDSLTAAEPPAMSHAWPPAGGASSASERIDDGGPAFPAPYVAPAELHSPFGGYAGHSYGIASVAYSSGMTLRDWFAATLPGLDFIDMAVAEAIMGRRSPTLAESPLGAFQWKATLQARVRYLYADAMLAVRKGGAS